MLNPLFKHLYGCFFILLIRTVNSKHLKVNTETANFNGIKRKKEKILITVKPKSGKDTLNKLVRFEGVSLVS